MTASFRAVLAIAYGTFLEAIRSRLLIVTLFFGVVLVGLSVAAASVSFGEQVRLITDVGLAAQSGIGTLIAIALSISSFAGEISRHTAYPVLARPISRVTFVVGKFIGLWLAVGTVAVIMILATIGVVALYGGPVAYALWVSLPLSIAEMAVAVGVALMFSALSAPVLAAAFSGGVLIAGNLVSDLLRLAERLADKDAFGAGLIRSLFFILPDVERLSVRIQAANQLAVPANYWLHGMLYGALYATTMVIVAAWIFTRRRVI